MNQITTQYQNRPLQNLAFAKEPVKQTELSEPKDAFVSQPKITPEQENETLKQKLAILSAFATVQNKIIQKLLITGGTKQTENAKPINYNA